MKTYKYYTMRLMRVTKLGSVLCAALFATCALQAQYTGPTVPQPPVNGNENGVSHAAREFMQDAAQANLTEIAMANIAETRAQNTVAKDLAKMMRTDHQQNFDLLQVMAQNHLIILDSKPDMLNQHAIHRLQKASDANFDKDYTKVMLKDHVKAITRFDKALADIQEPYVREYAESTLPALRKHLHHTEDAARAVGVDEGTISSILKGLPSDELVRIASN